MSIDNKNRNTPEQTASLKKTKERKIKSFKGFGMDMKCRDFQYEVGKEYEMDGRIAVCSRGFHACPNPMDVFSYYPPAESKYCEVEQSGTMDESESDKVCSSKIKIGAEIGIPGLVRAAVEYVRSRCTNEHNAEPGKPVTAGDGEAATAGESGAATAGNYGAATAGYKGAATAGYKGAATAGYKGAATAGSYGCATSRGKSAVGENGLAVVRGNNVMVKGGIGAILVIAEENGCNYDIVEWKAVVVDGVNIKADTWYKLVNGKLLEVED